MTESGLSSDVADRIIKGLADLQGTGSVDKDTGEATVTNRDKWGYIAALDGLSDKEKTGSCCCICRTMTPRRRSPTRRNSSMPISEAGVFRGAVYADLWSHSGVHQEGGHDRRMGGAGVFQRGSADVLQAV